MKTIVCFFLFAAFSMTPAAYAMEPSPAQAMMHETVVVERGGWFSRLRYRAELREYSNKIRARTITYDELKDYLAKGGSPTLLSGYRLYDDFEYPLLNYFMTGLSPVDQGHRNSPYQADQRQDLIKCLKLLLDNGADVEFVSKRSRPMSEQMPPFLFASWLGNVEVMALLIEHGADVNRVQDIAPADPWGPPLLLVPNDEAADLLLQHGADASLTFQNGLNLVQMLVRSTHYMGQEENTLRQLNWFKRNGFKFQWQDGSVYDPLQHARMLNRDYTRIFRYVTENVERKEQTWGQIAAVLEDLRE